MKLSSVNLNDQAYQALKNSIMNKELLPGTRLVDSQLAAQFGISRTPLRDAIRKLTEEGLVVKHSQKGYSVFCPSFKDINEIFELREILDIAACTKLIQEVLPHNPEAMEEIRRSYEGILETAAASPNDFVKNDEDLHDTIIRLTDNSRIISLYSDLKDQTRIFRHMTAPNHLRVELARQYHSRIYQGLTELDLEKTIDAIRTHVLYSKNDALSDFIKEQPKRPQE